MPAFSGAWLIAGIMDAAVAALGQRRDERGLSSPEIDQLATYEAVRQAAQELAPHSRGLYTADVSAEPLREAVRRCSEASAVLLIDLLVMRSAVPAAWRDLPVNLDLLLWLGVTRLIDDVALICEAAPGGPPGRRLTQLSMLRQLHGALGRIIERSRLAAPSAATKHAVAWADDQFARAASVIRDAEWATIAAEAATLRRVRR